MHLSETLPNEIALGAVEITDWNTTIVSTYGGFEVRRQKWDAPLRKFEVAFPPSLRSSTVYQAVRDLFEQAEGYLHSFDLETWTDESGYTIVPVRFDSPLTVESIAPHLDKIATFTLVEVREIS